MVAVPDQRLHDRIAPERACAIDDAHPLRWSWLERHPVVVALVALVTVAVTLGLENTVGDDDPYRNELIGIVVRAVLCGALVWFAAASGLLRAVGLTSSPRWRSAWLLWLPVLFLAYLLVGGIEEGVTDDGEWLAVSAVGTFLVGALEELLMRGLVLFLLLYAWRDRKQGVLAAVLISSAAFGAIHLINVLGSASLSSTLVQVVYATFVGVAMAAVVLRTNTLWFAIVWHACVDYVALGLPGPSEAGASDDTSIGAIVVTLPLFVYGLILLRRRKSAIAQPVTGN